MNRITIAMIALVGLAAATTYATAAGGPPFGRGQGSQHRASQGLRDGTGPGQGQGFGRMQGQRQGRGQECLFDQNTEPLSEEEANELLSMREEEKLARDVYLAMRGLWKQQVFLNISRAEQRHMSALARAIDRYDLEDPVVDNTPGVFTNPVFTALYEELVTAGSESVLEALKVGALVDHREALDATTHPDLQRVYENLMRGSRNHLRAFASRIAAADGTYEARHLTQEEFDAIAASPAEPGHGRRSGQRLRSGDGDGRGWANGQGRGQGSGRGLRNGVCDGTCRGRGMGQGNRQGAGSGRGQGMGVGQGNRQGAGQGRGQQGSR